MKSKDIIKEASVMDVEPSRDWRTDPAARRAKEREQALGADEISQILTPGVSSAQDIGDVAQGDYGALPLVALGMLPGGGAAKKLYKKLFGKSDREVSKAAAKAERDRLSNLSPAQRQADKETRSGKFEPSSKSKKGEEPVKRDEPDLWKDQKNYKDLDRPTVQRKVDKDKADRDTATKDKSSEPRYKKDIKTGENIPLNVQAQLQQKLQGKGFKEPESGSISGFKARPDRSTAKKDTKAEPKTEPKTEPKAEPKAEPAKVEPKTDQKMVFDPWSKKMIPASDWAKAIPRNVDPTLVQNIIKGIKGLPGRATDIITSPVAAAKYLWPKNKTEFTISAAAHAALVAYLWNIYKQQSGAEKAQNAGTGNQPLSVTLIQDPGSEKAANAASTSPSDAPVASKTTTDKSAEPATTTQPAAAKEPSKDSGEEKSLPPVVVTAKKDAPQPEKNQPVKAVDPTKKAEEPKADTVIATDKPTSWEVELKKDQERAEADQVNDKQSAKTTQAVTQPEEDEKDIIEKLKKLLGLEKNAQQANVQPEKEPAETEKERLERLSKLLDLDKNAQQANAQPDQKPTVANEPRSELKPEPVKIPQDGPGKGDAEKGDDSKRGDQTIAYPKYPADNRNDKPQDTEKTGQDTITRKTDSIVDIGPAATGRDPTTNYAPPPPATSANTDNDRSSILRDLRRREREQKRQEVPDQIRMEPVREDINHILNLANITKKEIVESTMNLDMRQMIALLDEATKMADIKGKKHTGKYGKEYDTDEEGDAKDKKAEPAEKKGRGRPKKDSNVEAGKYKGADDAASHVIGGKAPKGKSNLPSKKHTLKDWVEYAEQSLNESEQIDEKAVSKAQQKFMGMVHAAQKGKKPASKEVAKVAKTMGKKDAKDFAATKHKGLPEKVKEGEKFTSNGKTISKDQYDALRIAAGKNPSPANVKEALKGGQKNLDVAEPKGKLDAKDFAKLRAKKKIKEGVNFAEMMKETQMGIEEMLEELQQEIAEFKATGNMGDKLRDAFDIHRHSKNKLMGEAPVMPQTVVEEPLEENPFTYAARQAKASGDDSFKLGGETFPVKESQEEVDESGLQAYLGNKKYGKEGMDALRKAGREGASKEKMAKIRAKHDKMDEDGPGASRLYGDNEKSDFDVVDTMKKFANKGIDAYNDYEQSKKDRWDSIKWPDGSGGKPGSSGPAMKIPRFDTKDDNYPDEFNRGIKPEKELPPVIVRAKKEPESDIFDREKPYRDPRTGKMVTPPKGLSISEPYGKKGYPDAVDINAPQRGKERKSMKENFDFSLWDNQLEKMINESLTITTTQGDDEKDNSVSITASGEKAAEIMALLRNAGMESMGGQMQDEPVVVEPEQLLSAYGVPMSSDSSESGHDDIVSLMQKLTGLGSDEGDSEEMEFDAVEPEHEEHDSEDYEEEDNEDEGEEEDQAEEDSDEEDNSDEEEVDESYGQTDEGNKFTGNLAKARAAGKDEADLDGDGDMEKVREGEGETCNECGMYESKCSCDHEETNEGVKAMGMITPKDDGDEYQPAPGYRVRSTFSKGQDKPEMSFVKDKEGLNPSKIPDQSELPLQNEPFHGPRSLSTQPEKTGFESLESARPIEEELANGADDTTMQDIKYLIKTLAGGLNSEKRDQTTLPHTAVKMTESKEMLNEWKKLSGIK
jgi:hypothetical protein